MTVGNKLFATAMVLCFLSMLTIGMINERWFFRCVGSVGVTGALWVIYNIWIS